MEELGQELLRQARAAINAALNDTSCPAPLHDLPELQQAGATFVTLNKKGLLRGCIGTLEARRPLLDDVRSNAVAAAFRDSRFYPIEQTEFHHIKIEVSLLSLPQSILFNDEPDLLRQLEPDIDGLILRCGTYHATFLPQVWRQLPDPHDFVTQLKIKSGLPADTPIQQFNVARYRVHKWIET